MEELIEAIKRLIGVKPQPERLPVRVPKKEPKFWERDR